MSLDSGELTLASLPVTFITNHSVPACPVSVCAVDGNVIRTQGRQS